MKATENQNHLENLELSKDFAGLNDNETKEAAYLFKCIAQKLFEEYQIAKGYTRYNFEEIEFYLYTEGHKDNNHVYPRDCQAGEWFVHYSGVDLTFETLKEGNKITQCGGILIRRIKKVGSNSVGGPLRCLMELFNGQDAPTLVKKNREDVLFESTHRIGIKNRNVQDERMYRFVVNTNSKITSEFPQYTRYGIEIKPKKYQYEPKYE